MWNFIWSRRKPVSHIQFCFLLVGERYSTNWRLTWVVMLPETRLCWPFMEPSWVTECLSTPRAGYWASPTLRTTGYRAPVSSLSSQQRQQCTKLRLFVILSPCWSLGRENLVSAQAALCYRLASWFQRYSSPSRVGLSLKMGLEAFQLFHLLLWDTRNISSIILNCPLMVSK